MKKSLLLAVIACLASSTMLAQDDMYFTPRKKTAEEKAAEAEAKARLEAYRKAHTIGNTFYVGSNRNVDEYNRRGQAYTTVETDSVGNDVITFTPGTGEYPDSLSDSGAMAEMYGTVAESAKRNNHYDDDDFYYSRNLSLYYGLTAPYWGPWRHSIYYDPWYWDWTYAYSWGAWSPYDYYGPWSYPTWYHGPYYDPWVYGHGWGYAYHPWGWGGTIHVGGHHYGSNRNGAPYTAMGTRNHSGSRNTSGGVATTAGVNGVSRGVASRNINTNRETHTRERLFGNSRTTNTYSNNNYTNTNYSTSTPSRSTSSYSSGSSSGSRSTGSSFSGGSSAGRSGGSGSSRAGFGGRR